MLQLLTNTPELKASVPACSDWYIDVRKRPGFASQVHSGERLLQQVISQILSLTDSTCACDCACICVSQCYDMLHPDAGFGSPASQTHMAQDHHAVLHEHAASSLNEIMHVSDHVPRKKVLFSALWLTAVHADAVLTALVVSHKHSTA